ncbi:MAG: hypothetical protein ABWK01_06495 [Infirmifilum sp.]
MVIRLCHEHLLESYRRALQDWPRYQEPEWPQEGLLRQVFPRGVLTLSKLLRNALQQLLDPRERCLEEFNKAVFMQLKWPPGLEQKPELLAAFT